MAAITWQNINAPTLDATRGMAAVSDSINAAFANLTGVTDKLDKTNSDNWANTKVNNTQAFLDEVAKYRTVDEYQAAQKSGVLDQLRQSYGAQIDANAVRTAQDSRLATLQGRAEQDLRYGQVQRTEEQRPLTNRLASMIAAGDTVGAKLVLAAHPELDAAAKLSTDASTFDRKLVEQGQHDTVTALDTAIKSQNLANLPEKFKSEMATALAQQNASAAHIRASDSTVATNEAKAEEQRIATAAARAKATYEARMKGTLYEDGVLTGKDSQELYDILSKNDRIDGGEKNKVMERLAKLQTEGVNVSVTGPDGKITVQNVPIPKSLAKSILMGARDDSWISGWNSAPADYVETTLQKALQQNTVTKDAGGKDVLRNSAVDGLLELQAAQRSSIESPVAGVSKGPKASGEYKSPKTAHPKKDK